MLLFVCLLARTGLLWGGFGISSAGIRWMLFFCRNETVVTEKKLGI